MENIIVSPSKTSLSPKKGGSSPIKRHILKEISPNLNTSPISNADNKLSNASPVPSSSTLQAPSELQISVGKGSDESSDSSLDYGSANEDSTNRDDSLINAFNGFHLNTPNKADGNNLREKVLLKSLDGSVKFEYKTSEVSPHDDVLEEIEKVDVQDESQLSESQSLRKQKVFNIITECFETPDSSIIEDVNSTANNDILEIGHDPLNVSSEVKNYTINVPSIDPVIEKTELKQSLDICDSENSENQSKLDEDDCDNDGIAVISTEFVSKVNDECSSKAEINEEHDRTKYIPGLNESEIHSNNYAEERVSGDQLENVDDLDTLSTDSIAVLNSDTENLKQSETDTHIKSEDIVIVSEEKETICNNNGSDILIESQITVIVKEDCGNNGNVSNDLDNISNNTCNVESIDNKFQVNEISQDPHDDTNVIQSETLKSVDDHQISAENAPIDSSHTLQTSLTIDSPIKRDCDSVIQANNITVPLNASFSNKTVDTTEEHPVSENEIKADSANVITSSEIQIDNLNNTYSEPMECDEASFIVPQTEINNITTILESNKVTNPIEFEPMDCDDSIIVEKSMSVNTTAALNLNVSEQLEIGGLNPGNLESNISFSNSEISNHKDNLNLEPIVSYENFQISDENKQMDPETVESGNNTIFISTDDSIVPTHSIEETVGKSELDSKIDNTLEVSDSSVVHPNMVSEKPICVEADTCVKTLSEVDVSLESGQNSLPERIVCSNPSVDEENIFDESKTDPFKTHSRVLNTPEKSSTSSVDSNPFVTKSRIVNTPDKVIDREANPFTTRSKIVNTPERELSHSVVGILNTSNMASPSEKDTLKSFLSESGLTPNNFQNLPANVSNISDEDFPPMVFNDAEAISEIDSPEKKLGRDTEREPEKIGAMGDVNNKVEEESNVCTPIDDDCLDEEFKRPLVLQSELMSTDLDGLDSDSDTLSVSSSVNQSEFNPFETKSNVANSPERDEDKTLTFNRNDLNENLDCTTNATLISQNINLEFDKRLNQMSSSFDKEGNITDTSIEGKTNYHLNETVVISDTPERLYHSPKFGKSFISPDYNENTPKTTKPNLTSEPKEHKFVSPLAHDKRLKELAKRKITDKKTSNLSPMSRCGDLMGLSPVMHTESELAARCNVPGDVARDPFFCDDLEEEFKMPANFIKDNLDFLLSCGSNPANQYQCKESLLLKFDPLLTTRPGLPTGVRPGRATIPESPKAEEDASTASGLAESCSSDSSPLSTSIAEGKTVSKMSSMDQSLGAPSPKVVNVTPQPTEKPTQVVTPAISTRQSASSIASKNSTPVTPAKSVTSAIAAIDRLISLGGTPPPPPVVVQPKEPEMDPRLLAELQSVRELLGKQEDELRKSEDMNKGLQSQLADAVAREQSLIERLNDRTIDKGQLDSILEEYERTMTQFIGERDMDKRKWEEERAALIRDRDEANAHLANMEHSFNDIHAKYERCKAMIQGYKANEEILKETVRSNDEASEKQLERYEHLRQHAMSRLDIANQEIDTVKKASQAEIVKLQAMLKKSEINVTSLQESLAQKTKDIEELTAICDELIQKVG